MRHVLLACWLPLVGCVEPGPPHPHRGTEVVDAHAVHAHTQACRPAGFPTRWDRTIAAAEQRYLPASWRQVAPCGWRAQLAAESGLNEKWCTTANPHGTSASCLSQITAAAARDVARSAGITGSRTNPQASIRAGAFYLASMRRVWNEPRSTSCRRTLAVASYHGGAGTLIDGQRLARQAGRVARCYGDGIGEYLPRHGPENRAYVARVRELRLRMSP